MARYSQPSPSVFAETAAKFRAAFSDVIVRRIFYAKNRAEHLLFSAAIAAAFF